MIADFELKKAYTKKSIPLFHDQLLDTKSDFSQLHSYVHKRSSYRYDCSPNTDL